MKYWPSFYYSYGDGPTDIHTRSSPVPRRISDVRSDYDTPTHILMSLQYP